MRKGMLVGLLMAVGLGVLPGSAMAQPVDDTVREAVASTLELSNFTIQRLDVPAEHVSFVTDLTLGGLDYVVWIDPQSFRTEDAKATVVGDDGVIREITMPESLTIRGQLEGIPEARAAGSRLGGGLHLTIALPGAIETEIWTVQPLYDAIPGSDPALHVVHRADDMQLKDQWTCGIDHRHEGGLEQGEQQEGSGTRGFLVCELACDADFEYYTRNNSSEATTIADIDNVISRIAAIYEGQCNVTFRIPHYQIWTTSNDPYTSSDPSTRLNQFRNWWNSNMGSVQRDLAHGFTGVNLNGSVIGIAWLSAVCGSNGYGLVESKFTGGINARGALSAHEIGHNFSSGHCDGNGDCHIMCSGLGGCNSLGNPAFFGTTTANKIRNYAANRPCLDEEGLPYPFLEEWTSTTINDLYWVSNSGGVVNGDADGEPSGPYSLNLDAADSINTGAIDLAGVIEFPYLSFYAQHKGVEAGETLIAEYFDISSQWVELATVTSDGNDQAAFTFHNEQISVFGWWTDFAVRFRTTGNDGTDDWYVDNIAVGPFAGNPVPFHEPFASSGFNTTTTWDSISGAAVSTDATNEPSDPYSMNLDGSDSATTYSFLMGSAPFPTYLSFFSQHKGVENGEELIAEYRNHDGIWTNFTTVTSNGADQGTFQFHQSSLIFDAFHDDFAVRFRALGSDSTDDWYVDDIRLGDEFTPPDDCIADFNGDGTVNTQDVLAFLNAWSSGDPSADVNGDGSVNTQDVIVFLNLWNAGC